MNKSQEHAQFVMRNGKANFPDVTSDNLQAWYDVKGKKDTDFYKDTLIDLSGNGKDATLHNFAFEKRSGYLDDGGLIFDDVDDKLVYPSVKDEVEYTSASRNLFDKSYVVMGKYHNSPGTLVNELTSSASTQFIRVKQGVPYIWGSANKYNIIIMTFDSNKNPIERIVAYTVLSMSFSGNVEYVQVSSYQKNYDFNDFQFEEGSTATPYTSYVPLPVMTYQYNGNILSYEADGTVKRVDDGKVITRKGINLVRNDVTNWGGVYGTVHAESGEFTLTVNTLSNPSVRLESRGLNTMDYQKDSMYYISGEINTPYEGETFLQFAGNSAGTMETELNRWTRGEGIIQPQESGRLPLRFYHRDTRSNFEVGSKWRYRNIQIINLTEAYGAGNEPDLEYIQSHPKEFAWTPNPNDLIEAHEIKNNLVGDLEDLHGTGDKTEILSGTEIYTDKADDSVVHVDIDGKSVGGGSGKNLATNSLEVGYDVGSGWVNSNAYRYFKTQHLPVGTYTLSSNTTMGWRVEPVADTDITTTWSRFGQSLTFKVSKSGIFNINMRNTDAISLGDNYLDMVDMKLQLEEGSTTTEYEPPAPSPDYPIEIHSVNDFDVVSSVGRRNLIKNSSDISKHYTSGYQGASFQIEKVDMSKEWGFSEAYRIKLSGGTNAIKGVWASHIQGGMSMELGKEYTWSAYIKNLSPDRLTINTNGLQGGSNFVLENGFSERVFSTGVRRVAYDWFQVLLQTPVLEHDIDVIIGRFKTEEGNAMTPWSPSLEDITESTSSEHIDKTNILLSEPLRSVGDVKDRLFRDSDGIWKVERKVGEYTLTGSETYKLFENTRTNTQSYTVYGSTERFLKEFAHFTSNHAQNNVSMNRFNLTNGTSGDHEFATAYSDVPNINHWLWFNINRSRLSQQTVEGFREWLTKNPTTILYVRQPIVEILPEADQDKLNNIASYKDSNYLYTVVDKTNTLPSYVRDNLKPNLNAKFRKLSWFWSRLLFYQLKIWSKNLTDDELIHEYKINKRRWGM